LFLKDVELERLNDTAARALIARRPVVILPIGAVESHGEHLPAGTDNILAQRLSVALIERIAGRTPVMLLPIIPFGQVWSLADQPASFSLSNETICRVVVEIGLAMRSKGLHSLAVVNTHYGNAVVLKDAQRRLREERVTLANLCYPGAAEPTRRVRETPVAHPSYMHACEIETSYMLHLAPETVDMSKATVNYPEFPHDFAELSYRWSEFSQSPVLGDATAATAEKGRAILDAVLDRMAELVGDLYSRQSSQR
jgi:creatinine amidohydrolase